MCIHSFDSSLREPSLFHVQRSVSHKSAAEHRHRHHHRQSALQLRLHLQSQLSVKVGKVYYMVEYCWTSAARRPPTTTMPLPRFVPCVFSLCKESYILVLLYRSSWLVYLLRGATQNVTNEFSLNFSNLKQQTGFSRYL